MGNMNVNQEQFKNRGLNAGFAGQRWLVEERDACGVGFLADQYGRASHTLITQALSALTCLEHRGACSADQDSGDGAGLMTAIPWPLLQEWLNDQEIKSPSPAQMGVGMVFLPQHESAASLSRQIIEEVIRESSFKLLGWRPVPVKPNILGVQALEHQPRIEQLVVQSVFEGEELERELYLLRRQIGHSVAAALSSDLSNEVAEALEDLYICSFSSRTIIYKGMVRSSVLGEFYTDLTNPLYESPFAVYHRRFSTNTMPRWPLAQPMRLLGHNGEINTLLGNINWMMAREADLDHQVWGDRLEILKPIVNPDNSDSATLDNVAELLVHSGRSPLDVLTMMVPEAYQNQPDLVDHPEIVDFYEYYSGIQEPWDGPALLVFSDGKKVGACLDRNGLRPARYALTRDGYVVVSSEAGVIGLAEEDIIEKGRLGPGQAIAVDLETHEVLKNWDIKQRVARSQPYGQWLKDNRFNLESQAFTSATQMPADDLLRQQTAFGYTTEDVEMIIEAMASQGKEPTFCMGDDIPLAILSDKPRLLYDYFKQRFAQVTNPPIDPLRESLVMSLSMQLGERGNLLDERPEYSRLLKLKTPVLNERELSGIQNSGFEVEALSTQFQIAGGPNTLQQSVNTLCEKAAAAVRSGKKILILSDRLSLQGREQGLNENDTYIPPMLAVGAVHHHLIRHGLRMKASIVIDTAQCWSTHHFAALIGYGASAVCPYLTWETVRQWWSSSKTQTLMQKERIPSMTIEGAQENYRHATEAGLLKILSKMGISLLSSYHGAQIFEAIGIGSDLLNLAFAGTTSRVGGLTIAELAQEVMAFHQRAFPELTTKKLENFGFIQYRPGGEYHMNSPEMAKALHKAVTDQNYDHYQVYQTHLEGRLAAALRDLLDFQSDRPSISIDEVEPVEEIVMRFCTGGMSLGALSREAHETLAVAMNRIGGKSNSGEGGEDPTRFKV
ncbi:MAG TPA: glutamate synthase central domain-containing protein, partial [Elainellaceae cyanobacterium]